MNVKVHQAPGPDQPIGWVIAMACFMINFIMVGIARTAGILYVALIEMYGVNREAAAAPFSVRVCVRNMTGPFIGLLGLRYGIRAVTAVGGFVAAAGCLICYFASDVVWITIFWGIFHGLGSGFSTVMHMMIINQYFDKYRASALGLGYLGDCFGTFAFPVIMDYLLSTYGLKGTYLILSGVILNVIPMALLLKKPPWVKDNKKMSIFKKKIFRKKSKSNKSDKELLGKSFGYRNEGSFNFYNDMLPNDGIDLEVHYNKYARQNDTFPFLYKHRLKSSPRFGNYKKSFKHDISSISGSLRLHRKPFEILRTSMVRHESLPPVFQKEDDGSIVSENSEDIESTIDGNCQDTEKNKRVQFSSSVKRTQSFVAQMAEVIVNRIRSATLASQVAQDGFVTNIEIIEECENFEPQPAEFSGTVCQQIQTDLQIEKIRAENSEGYSFWSVQVQETKKPEVLKSFIRINVKPIFILISITMAVYTFLFSGVLIIIIDYALDQGISQDVSKFLIIGFSVADLIGRLIFVQVIDRKLVKMKNYSGLTMLLTGILIASLPFNKSFQFMTVCMCLYGIVQGGIAIMFPMLIRHYMVKSEESVAMCCLNFYGGFLMLCLPPMIGYFRDITGSYKGVFHILGCLVSLVGLIWQIEPAILNFQKKQMLKSANYIIVTKL